MRSGAQVCSSLFCPQPDGDGGAFSSVFLGKQDAPWPFLRTSHLRGFFPASLPQQSHRSAFWFFPPPSAIPLFSFLRLFDMDHFKSLYRICYNVAFKKIFWSFDLKACGILAPRPGAEPTPPALALQGSPGLFLLDLVSATVLSKLSSRFVPHHLTLFGLISYSGSPCPAPSESSPLLSQFLQGHAGWCCFEISFFSS